MIRAQLAARHDAEKLVRMNGRLEGLSKFALLPGDREAHLCAEIPLDDQLDLRERLRETCEGFKNALRVLHQERPILVDSGLERKGEQVDLHRLCEEAGWPFTEKSEGKLTIDLDTRGAFFQAWAKTDTTGAISVSVELARYENAADESKEALATLLLKASGAIRMARAAIEENENQTLVYFETKFASRPCATEWHHALSSLSVACALCAQESKALDDTSVARKYTKSMVAEVAESGARSS